jgi:transposase
MEDPRARYDALLQAGVRRLRGHQRRLFMAEVARDLCAGSPRQAERRFGWGRGTVTKGLHELAHGIRCQDNFSGRGRPRWEDQHPQRAHDIRAVVDPRCHADPELKSDRRYTNLSAAEVLQALKAKKGYRDADLPSVRTMRDILNRLGYRLKRIQKAKPLKKTKDTDAIFANVQAVRDQYKGDPDTLEVSVDTKAKVNEGDYSRGGKNPDGLRRPGPEGVGP